MARTPRASEKAPAPQQDRSLKSVLCGLQFRWTAMLTVFMLTLTLVGDTLFRRKIEQLIVNQQFDRAVKQCDALAAVAGPALLSNDRVGLRQLADRFRADTSLLYVEFFSSAGTPLTSSSAGKVAPPVIGSSGAGTTISRLSARAPRIHVPEAPSPIFMDVARAVHLSSAATARDGHSGSDPQVGYLRAGFDLSHLQGQLGAFLQKIRYASILSIVITIPLSFMVVRRITGPINRLSTVVNQLADGDFRVRASIPRSDEIGLLANAFNGMADELASSNDRLVKLNAELEDRVLQRTRQLKDLAERDPLTGLYNRRHLSEVLTRRFAEAERYGNGLSCMMIDLDNFKEVNDRFGHEMGDQLLILTASVINSQLRGADVGARFGGDEFCILLPQTSAAQAHQVGERIVQEFQVELDNHLPDHRERFGISVGVAGVSELSLVHPDELIKAADQALYGAKEAGKNRIRLAETLT